MSWLFVGGEQEGLSWSGTPTWVTTAARHDADFSRGALRLGLTVQGTIDLSAGETEIWVHAGVALDRVSTGDNDAFIRLIDTATGREVVRVFTDASFQLSFSYWDGSTYQTVTGTEVLAEETFYAIDLHLDIADSGGEISLYVDQTLSATFSGDTLHSDFTQIDRVRFASNNSFGGTAGLFLSQIVIADEDTRGKNVKTHGASGDGANTAWTGDYTAIDETVTFNDGDLISSNTADQVETFTLGDVVVTGYDVNAVSVVARAKNSASGPQNLQAALRVDGTDYFSGNLNGIGTAYAPAWNVWPQNPDTSAAWAVSEVDALEAGVKSIT